MREGIRTKHATILESCRSVFWPTFVFLLLLANSSPTEANDSEAELGIGGLVLRKSPHIEMKSEVLTANKR